MLPSQPESSIEPEYAETYNAWKAKPTPQSSTAFLNAMNPAIDRALSAHADVRDPILRSRARRLALDAAKKYDPNMGVKLGTHLMNQLQTLRRINRQSQQILRMPERVSLEKAKLDSAEAELVELLGREPTAVELADHTSMPVKRIKYVRKFQPGIAEGTLQARSEALTGDIYDPAVQQASSNKWVEALYADQDPVNQKIMEWSLGLFGSSRLSNQQIASKLRISPGAVSQRKIKIQKLIDQQQSLGMF